MTFEGLRPDVWEGVARVMDMGSKRGFWSVRRNWMGMDGVRFGLNGVAVVVVDEAWDV